MSAPDAPFVQLYTRLKALYQRWEETKRLWDDPVRWDFERRYWEPLERETTATLHEMERLADVLAKARRNVRMPWG